MDFKQIMNQRQLAWLTSSIITSVGIFTLQNVLIRINEMDAWMSYMLSLLYVFAIAAFFAFLSKRFPGKHLFEITMELLGRWGGTLANLIMLFHIWMLLVSDISSISRFASTLLLQETPLEVLVLLPCMVLLYYGKTSVEVVARVNDLFYPLFVSTILLMPLMLSNELYLRFITPVLTTSMLHLAHGNMLMLGSAGDIFVLGAFLHTLYNGNHIRSAIRHGTMLGIFLLTIITFMEIIVLGPKMPGNFLYPPYNLVQMIHITDFLDRLDIIILTIWFPTIICKTVAIYLAFLLGICSLIKERDYTSINKPSALFILMTTMLSFKSTTELLSFANFSSPLIVLSYQPLLILLLFAMAKWRHAHVQPEMKQSNGGADPNLKPTTQVAALSTRFTYKQWTRIGNMLIAVAGACLLLGLTASRHIPAIGFLCGIGYVVCLILVTLSTYMEVSHLKKTQADG